MELQRSSSIPLIKSTGMEAVKGFSVPKEPSKLPQAHDDKHAHTHIHRR